MTPIQRHQNLNIVEHPLIMSKLSLLRDKQTNHKLFRELVHEITLLLGYEATQHLKITYQKIDTPVESQVDLPVLSGPDPIILPILRAGIGMVEALTSLMPAAKVGHIGLFRNETTFQPESYYFKVPAQCSDRNFFVCDPMLATGGSAAHAVKVLKARGVKQITFICVLAAPEGVATFSKAHPDVPIYTAAVDRCINEKGYILPGLGDAGDRLFGTL